MIPYIDIHTHSAMQHHDIVSVYNIMARLPEQLLTHSHGLYSVGVHPWDAAATWQDQSALHDKLTAACLDTDHSPTAIGETGLDLRHDYRSSLTQQMLWFESQVELATRFNKPLIIHSVRATEPTLEVLQAADVPVIIHAFTGSIQTATRYLNAGFHLSFGLRTLDSPKSIQALTHCPTDRLFFESDDSTTSVTQLYDTVCALRPDVEIEQLKIQIITNFEKITKCHLPLGLNAPNCF